jgi:polyketide synthase 12
VAGVIKMVLAMRHGRMAGSLHIDGPNPHVDWDSGAVRLLTEARDWPQGVAPRRAGVSSFGASGTNAHLILEQATEPDATEPAPAIEGVVPWLISARNEAALRAQASRLKEFLRDHAASSGDVAWSLATTRSVLEHRAVVVGEDTGHLLAGLDALAEGGAHAGLVTGTGNGGSTVWLFSGQGSQRARMGAGLYERFEVFRAAFDEVCDLLDPYLDHDLAKVVLTGDPDVLDHTTYAQTGLFALQVALGRLLTSMGVTPGAVVGHSIGEVAAAHVAGVFGLADACRLVAARAGLIGGLPTGGAMASIQATPEELAPDLGDGPVVLAAVNTPTGSVISGPADAVETIRARWSGKDRKTKRLTVSHAFHSPLMEPIVEEFRAAITGLDFRPPTIPIISTLTGQVADDRIATPEYWADQIRRPVLFRDALTRLADHSGVFLELGPDPILATATRQTLDQDRATPATAVSALTHRRSDADAFCHALATLHATGTRVDWTRWFPATPRVIDLPTYAFQHRRHWPEGNAAAAGDPAGLGLAPAGHPLLGATIDHADDGGLRLTGRLSATGATGWLADHRVAGAVVAPTAVMVEWALRAADAAGCASVADLTVETPLVIPKTGRHVQVTIGAARDDGRRDLGIYSRDADAAWRLHARGTLAPDGEPADATPETAWPPPGAEPLDLADWPERAQAAGLAHGPALQGLRAAWRDGSDLLAEADLPEAAGPPDGYGVHPALLDAVLQTALLTLTPPADGDVWLPATWERVTLHATHATVVRARLIRVPEDEHAVRLTITDGEGAPVLTAHGIGLRSAPLAGLDLPDPADLPPAPAAGWTERPRAAGGGPAPGQADHLRGLPEDERQQVLLDLVLTNAAAVLGHADASAIEPERGFNDIGFESITAIELRDRLVAVTGLDLSASVVFDHPNPVALADHLDAEIVPRAADDLTSVLGELDRLENVLLTVAADDSARTKLRKRIQTTFTKLDDLSEDEATATAADWIEAATASEIFDFIDRELGRQANGNAPLGSAS